MNKMKKWYGAICASLLMAFVVTSNAMAVGTADAALVNEMTSVTEDVSATLKAYVVPGMALVLVIILVLGLKRWAKTWAR